ncbi:MAG: NAD(+) synthase, partial [Lentisphaeria bacterium]|nr:NAD(+) synthase [Lentisphaeria bacterium]
AAVVQRGNILGVVPKIFLPGSNEYYEPRWFSSGSSLTPVTTTVAGQCDVPVGCDMLFRDADHPDFCFCVELCEDLWAPIPPSGARALAGATIIANPSASNELVGKAEYRRDLVRQQSARCLAAYVYCSAGVGESTTDMVFGGHCMVAENGTMLAERERFLSEPGLTVADVDVQFLRHERVGNKTFAHGKAVASREGAAQVVSFTSRSSADAADLRRRVDPHPFVPADDARRHDRCQEILAIQSTGLATRLQHTGLRDVVVGLSGGLDSTLALLVCIDAFQRLDLPLAGIHAVTMPGFGTTKRTKGNADALCEQLGIPLATISIEAACKQHFQDIGHDGTTTDIAYENVQARERTQILMDMSNMQNALVVGTGDLSELALGWCTYNGDHMSMYAVNTGVPKTLVSYLIATYAKDKADPATAVILEDILDTPISPELLPPDENGDIAQKTESVVGPYELHDFFLYHVVRCGFSPPKTLFLAEKAFEGMYPPEELKRWMKVFLQRFFGQQFKRSCLPDGPKVGTIALSPRGDWRMPSDAAAADWLESLE